MNRIGLRVRLPADAKAFIEAEAAANASSQNSEIVRSIRERMKQKGPAGSAIPPGQGHLQPLEKADERGNG